MSSFSDWLRGLNCHWLGHDYVARDSSYITVSVCTRCGQSRMRRTRSASRVYVKRKAG